MDTMKYLRFAASLAQFIRRNPASWLPHRLTIFWALLTSLLATASPEVTVLRIQASENRTLSVADNEVLRIHAYGRRLPAQTDSSFQSDFLLSKPGISAAPIQLFPGIWRRPVTLSGPVEIALPTGMDQLLYYTIASNSVYRTAFALRTNITRIEVPAGKALRHYDSQPLAGTNTATSSLSGRSHPTYRLLHQEVAFRLDVLEAGFELPGPAILEITGAPDDRLRLLTFSISDYKGIATDSIISAPGGRTAVLLETSKDLLTWSLFYFDEFEGMGQEFYRIRVGE